MNTFLAAREYAILRQKKNTAEYSKKISGQEGRKLQQE
jgi:hypothetical protein